RGVRQAGVSGGEGGDIGGAVAAQIDDLLARRAGEGALTRADVLAVLAQLDPPESYAPEGYEPPAAAPRPRRPRGPRRSRLADGAATLAALALLLGLPTTALLLLAGGGELALIAGRLTALLALAAGGAGAWGVVRVIHSR